MLKLQRLDLQVAGIRLRAALGRARRSAPRFAVVGGCQAFGVAYGLRLLRPGAQVDCFNVEQGSATKIETLARVLKTYDGAFCSSFADGLLRGGDSAALLEASGASAFPTVVFCGYHPDFLYLMRNKGSVQHVVNGPVGPYHSAIVVFAFLNGFSQAQALALFHRHIFERLGYFQMFDWWTHHLLGEARAANLDLAAAFLRWTRRGCFMHTVNHPKAHVLFDIARALLARAGETPADIDFDDFHFDPIATLPVCPVYEPIAAELGLRGSYLFRAARPADTSGGVITLPEFIARSYACYERLPRAAMGSPRMDLMLADGALRDELRAFADAHISGTQ